MNFSENSRVWIYQADRNLEPQELVAIQNRLNTLRLFGKRMGRP
ncbi:MAG: hypothetical protein ACKOWL_07920 [Sphingobacteriaceae bacterium]